jgi:uncharacterized membrane protein
LNPPVLTHFHSGWRWVVLLLLLLAIVGSFSRWRNGHAFTPADLKRNLFALAAVHLQFVTGLILYFMSPRVQLGSGMMKDSFLRFYAVEHFVTMILAVALVTIGYSKSKRARTDASRFRLGFWFYLAGLLLILAGIPWPFRSGLGGGWF